MIWGYRRIGWLKLFHLMSFFSEIYSIHHISKFCGWGDTLIFFNMHELSLAEKWYPCIYRIVIKCLISYDTLSVYDSKTMCRYIPFRNIANNSFVGQFIIFFSKNLVSIVTRNSFIENFWYTDFADQLCVTRDRTWNINFNIKEHRPLINIETKV